MAEYVYEVNNKLFRNFESAKEEVYKAIDRWIEKEDYYNGTPEEKAEIYARDRAEWRGEVADWDENAPKQSRGWAYWEMGDIATCYKRELF